MTNDRLSQIEKNLAILYKQKAALESEALLYSGLPKIRAEQQIEEEVAPKIQSLEAECQQILAAASEQLQISEPEAETVIAEIVQGVTQLETQPMNSDFAEVLQILRQLRDKANEPEKAASLKVKGMISTFPPLIGVFIEPEIDPKALWQRYFPNFKQLIVEKVKK
jgi:flagellar motility protein MotE (MotC chaperone)